MKCPLVQHAPSSLSCINQTATETPESLETKAGGLQVCMFPPAWKGIWGPEPQRPVLPSAEAARPWELHGTASSFSHAAMSFR